MLTPFTVAQFQRGSMVWYVWANGRNSGTGPATSTSTYTAFLTVVDSFLFGEQAPTDVRDVRVFGAAHRPVSLLTSIHTAKAMMRDAQVTAEQLGAPTPVGNLTSPKNGDIWCGSSFHTGAAQFAADTQGSRHDNIISAQYGKVVVSKFDTSGYGELVLINHNDNIFGAYAHLQDRFVSEGQGVNKGTKVGTMGNSGTEAVHLHFHLRNGNYQGININAMPGFRNFNNLWPAGGSSFNCCQKCAYFG